MALRPPDRPASASASAPPVVFEPLSSAEFDAFRRLILQWSGISLGDSKQQLVASRLARRLRACGLSGYRDYLERVRDASPEDDERREMLNAITTNKTDFFRERHH